MWQLYRLKWGFLVGRLVPDYVLVGVRKWISNVCRFFLINSEAVQLQQRRKYMFSAPAPPQCNKVSSVKWSSLYSLIEAGSNPCVVNCQPFQSEWFLKFHWLTLVNATWSKINFRPTKDLLIEICTNWELTPNELPF